jgi:tetratricopeptide (TPR) repeat protein
MSFFSKSSPGTASPSSPPTVSAEDLVAQGTALARQGDVAGAVRCYESAISIQPGAADTWLRKGNACRDLGESTEAIRCYDEAILLRPGISAPWTLKGNVLGDQGRFRAAVECYDAALRLQPGNIVAEQNRGEAVRALRRSMTAGEWIGWGLSYFARGDYARANECYEIALELDPANPAALRGRAEVIGRQGNAVETIEGAERAGDPDQGRD